jgi:hypothetical protein
VGNITIASDQEKFDQFWRELITALNNGDLNRFKPFWNRWILVSDVVKFIGIIMHFGKAGDGRVITQAKDALGSESTFFEYILSNALFAFFKDHPETLVNSQDALTDPKNSTDPQARAAVSGILSDYSVYTEYLKGQDVAATKENYKRIFGHIPTASELQRYGITLNADWSCVVNTDRRTKFTSQSIGVSDYQLFKDKPWLYVDFLHWLVNNEGYQKYLILSETNFTALPWSEIQRMFNSSYDNSRRSMRYTDTAFLGMVSANSNYGWLVKSNIINLNAALKAYLNEKYFVHTAADEQARIQKMGDGANVAALRNEDFVADEILALECYLGIEGAGEKLNNLSSSADRQRVQMLINNLPGAGDKSACELKYKYLTGQIGSAVSLRTGMIDGRPISMEYFISHYTLGPTTVNLLSDIADACANSVKIEISAGQNGLTAQAYIESLVANLQQAGIAINAADRQEIIRIFLAANDASDLELNSRLRAGQSLYIPFSLLPPWTTDPAEVRTTQSLLNSYHNDEAKLLYILRSSEANRNTFRAMTSTLIQSIPIADRCSVRLQVISAGSAVGEKDRENYEAVRNYFIQHGVIPANAGLEEVWNALAIIKSESEAFFKNYDESGAGENRAILEQLGYIETSAPRTVRGYTLPDLGRQNMYIAYSQLARDINTACGSIVVDTNMLVDILQNISLMPVNASQPEKADLLLYFVRKYDLRFSDGLVECMFALLEGRKPSSLQLSALRTPATATADLDALLVFSGVLSAQSAAASGNRNAGGVKLNCIIQNIERMSNAQIALLVNNLRALYDTADARTRGKIEALILNSPALMSAMLDDYSTRGFVANYVVLPGLRKDTADDRKHSAALENTITALRNRDASSAAGYLQSLLDTYERSVAEYTAETPELKQDQQVTSAAVRASYSINTADGVISASAIPPNTKISLVNIVPHTFNTGELKGKGPFYLVQYEVDGIQRQGYVLNDGLFETLTSTYTVASGDTPGSITGKLKEQYGINITWQELFRLNGIAPTDANARSLQIGQILKIPVPGSAIPARQSAQRRGTLSLDIPVTGEAGVKFSVSGFDLRLSEATTEITVNGQICRLDSWVPGKNGRRFAYNGQSYILRYESGWKIEKLTA